MTKRCSWVKMTNPLYIAYHDEEWGQPLHDDQALFELLCMETYQAGLSWETVLNKRQAPAKTPLSEKLAKDLKKRGFKFTGPVAVLSFLQAAGLVDDHENDCEWKGLK
ncbi:TPA: DNA-3-methyladenine glycosylase I [Streptococcus pneumoniae]